MKMETSLPNSPSTARVTDFALQLRKPTLELTSQVRESIISQSMQAAQKWFLVRAKTFVHWSQPALLRSDFRELLKQAGEDTMDYFRTQFLQGTPGEDIPFWRIKSAQESLEQLCEAFFPLFEYANDYKSWWICTEAKAAAVAMGGKKGMKLYEAQAQGVYAEKCRQDLELLLFSTGKLELDIRLTTQISLDEDTLAEQLKEAEKQAKCRIDTVFDVKEVEGPRSRLYSESDVVGSN